MNKEKILHGVKILVDNWLEIQPGVRLLIITDEFHKEEMMLVDEYSSSIGGIVSMIVLPHKDVQHGGVLNKYKDKIFSSNITLGATNFAISTNEIIAQAVKSGVEFLSFPMATKDKNLSFLESDAMKMDPVVSKLTADYLISEFEKASEIHVTTELGTDLFFSYKDRQPASFVGVPRLVNGYGSSSFEFYIPIEETKTYGHAVVDLSLGYLGAVKEPFRIEFKDGKIVKIESSHYGTILKDYIESFRDENMYHCSEFGIGLNLLSDPIGNSYIEDESAYGTFHTGFGRNIALGGKLSATGHFDLVYNAPNVFVSDKQIIKNGFIIL